jgi:hypothetical protein
MFMRPSSMVALVLPLPSANHQQRQFQYLIHCSRSLNWCLSTVMHAPRHSNICRRWAHFIYTPLENRMAVHYSPPTSLDPKHLLRLPERMPTTVDYLSMQNRGWPSSVVASETWYTSVPLPSINIMHATWVPSRAYTVEMAWTTRILFKITK